VTRQCSHMNACALARNLPGLTSGGTTVACSHQHKRSLPNVMIYECTCPEGAALLSGAQREFEYNFALVS
jgi:hypothetical protein